MHLSRQLRSVLAFVVCGAVYVAAVLALSGKKRADPGLEMEVALPRFMQVAMAAGDRYLAANISGFRVLVASTEHMKDENYAVQARLQSDISWFNPAHEDNYYIAAAILPWANQLSAAQYVLRRAAHARPNDWMPAFYYAFDVYYFEKNPALAAEWLTKASLQADDAVYRMALQNLAAKWYELGFQPGVAAGVVEALADQARESAFRKYLKQRAARLRNLDELRNAAASYEKKFGRRLGRLDELVEGGILSQLPSDPLGVGYGVDQMGNPVLLTVDTAANTR